MFDELGRLDYCISYKQTVGTFVLESISNVIVMVASTTHKCAN